jgi:hypothetical protein
VGSLRLTSRDLETLTFAAEHRVVLADHVAALRGVSATAAASRLRSLSKAGYLTSHRPFDRGPACFQIARSGLEAIGADLKAPRRLDLRSCEHELGAAWLWLAASSGTFGPLREVLGERRMRSSDASPERPGAPHGVRLGGVGPGGRERLHYPDLLLIDSGGRRIAIELELSSKGRARREKILAGYAADARVDAVLYLVRDRRIGRAIQKSARRLGIGALVHVQRVEFPGIGPAGSGRAIERTRTAVAVR